MFAQICPNKVACGFASVNKLANKLIYTLHALNYDNLVNLRT